MLLGNGMLATIAGAVLAILIQEYDLPTQILTRALFALACVAALPAIAQNLPSGSMLGPSAGRVPSNMVLKWVFKIEVESVDQGAIDQVQAIFMRTGFHAESTQITSTPLPTLWQIEGTKEYTARSTRADAVLAEIKKAIADDTGKFSWTVTPKLAPKKR